MKTALLALFLLTGCATGVTMDKDEEAACKAEGCTAWTTRELSMLARKFYNEGYKAGVNSI
jgi:hypothetical protein